MEVNILLVIVGGIIAIGAIVGFAKGAVRIAVSLGATILTLAVVYFATPYVSKAIYSLTPIDEMVEQQCIKTMTKAFTGEADTNSGFTEEQVRGILSAAGVSEQTLEARGITVEDIVNGNVSDEIFANSMEFHQISSMDMCQRKRQSSRSWRLRFQSKCR